MTDLQKNYNEEIVPKLTKELGIKNPMALPKLTKIVVNMGVKDAVNDKKVIDKMATALGIVTGQKAKPTQAKKAIAGFKIRQGDTIGLVITIRGNRMYDFYDRLIKIVLPRIKDFRGVPRTSFDGRGNYTLGFHEYSTFPEIDPASVERLQGMEMIFVTSALENKHGFALLEALGMPFTKEAKKK
ncbi:MAG: 50S ribosomal protein L5 [Candidatus Levybacteria bacterium]|nr:50S ribosomal protein L5 [Candidatus Levybacteria bacterium]